MIFSKFLISLIFLLIVVSSAYAGRIFMEQDQVKQVPFGFQQIVLPKNTDLLNTERFQLTIALKQRNTEVLRQILDDVSTPDSPHYGQYLSASQVRDLVAPLDTDTNIVIDWLRAAGVDQVELVESRDFLKCEASLATWQQLLEIRFSLFVHQERQARLFRTLDTYSVPEEIAHRIDFISSLHRFPRFESKLGLSQRIGARAAQQEKTQAINAPYIVEIFPGDSTLRTLFMPRCQDGSVANGSLSSCQHGFDEFKLFVNDQDHPYQSWVEFLYPPSESPLQICQACSQFTGSWHAWCNSVVSSFKLSAQTVFCLTDEVGPFPNYHSLDIQLGSVFGDGTTSSKGTYFKSVYLGQWVTPELITQRYGVPVGSRGTASGNSMSVAEFLGQYYSPVDLKNFFTIMGIENDVKVDVIGPNNVTQPGGEAQLDIEYLMGIAPAIPTTFWSVGGLNEYQQEPFLEWIVAVLNDKNPPLVHSISYGDDEPTLGTSYMQRVSSEFAKAGSQGITLVVSSGDNGVNSADPSTPGCPNKFVPSFPASADTITAVGGTQMSTQYLPVCLSQTANQLGTVCDHVGEIMSSTETGSRITSGGGFSNVFAQPSYQSAAVKSYVANSLQETVPSSYYNVTGRCYPDVSILSRNYLVMLEGEIVPTDGTSCSAPAVAALIALINDARLSAGKSPVGFINNAIYAMPTTAFTDIVMGNNRCPEILSDCCSFGLPAAPQYDAVTGRGTPVFPVWKEYFISLK